MRTRTWLIRAGLVTAAACGKVSEAPAPDAAVVANPDVVCDGKIVAAAVGRIDAAITITALRGELKGVLALNVDPGGNATGSLSILGSRPSLQAVSGRLADGCLALAAGEATVAQFDKLTWERFEIKVGGAGRIEGGSGRLVGAYAAFTGEGTDRTGYSAALSVAADTAGEPFDVVGPEARRMDQVLPSDVLTIELGEPAAAVSTAAIRVLGDQVVVAPLEPRSPPLGGLITALSFRGPGFLPFGATISAEPGALADPSGNPLGWRGRALHTVADPGPIVSNLGFENGITGWSTSGAEVKASGAFDGVDPVEGGSQLIVRENSALAGYFDVASDATSLSLSIALLSERVDFDPNRSGFVALHRANGERIVLFDAQADRERSLPCTCGDSFRARIAPARKTIDLTPYRGERLFLTAEAISTPFFFGPKLFALVLDDLRIE